MNTRKATWKKILAYIIAIPVVAILLVGLVLYLLFVPFDIIRYHRMPYYKDTKTKYKLFITSKDTVLLYNKIKQKNLPIEYICNKECEYFIKDGTVLLPGWCYDDIEEIDGEWYFLFVYNEETGQEDTTVHTPVQDELTGALASIKEEHKVLPAKFLALYSDITDAEKFEALKKCPFFHAVDSIDEI